MRPAPGEVLHFSEDPTIRRLRVLPQLHDFWDAVIGSTLEFSGIRLRNAVPRSSGRAR